MTARTPRLLLRPMRESDRGEFLRVHEISRELWAPWVPARYMTEPAERLFEEELAKSCAALASGTGVRLVAEMLVERPGAIAGMFNLNNLVRGVFLNADASWQLAADATGRGLGTEAVGAMLDLAFAPSPRGLGLHRVQANIIPENARSIALATRCGFRREGVARAMLKIAGMWRDHIMFAKLAEEHAGTGAVLGGEGAAGEGGGV